MKFCTYKQLGERIGALVDEKSIAYGDSFGKSEAFLQLLYPDGIPAAHMHHALVLARIFDKLSRIATDPEALGESPYIDVAGYALLGARMHEMRKNGCGSARQGAVDESKEQNGSAVQSVPRPTITSDAEPSAKSSPLPSTAPPSDTSNASAVLAAANEKRAAAVALAARVRERNEQCGCGICTEDMKAEWVSGAWGGEYFYFCSRELRAGFHRALQGGTA